MKTVIGILLMALAALMPFFGIHYARFIGATGNECAAITCGCLLLIGLFVLLSFAISDIPTKKN